MREYYRHARVVDRAVRQAIEAATEQPGTLLGRFHEWRSRLSTSEFTVSRDRVLLRTPQPPRGSERCSSSSRGTNCAWRRIPSTACAGFAPQGRLGGLEAPAVAAACRRLACGPCRKPGSGGGASGVAQHRVPGGARFLPSLHGGRTHAGGHRGARSVTDGRFAESVRRRSRIRRWCASRCCCTISAKAPGAIIRESPAHRARGAGAAGGSGSGPRHRRVPDRSAIWIFPAS